MLGCSWVLGRGAGQARGGWAALRRLRAAHEWLLLELGAPVPRGGEPAVDAAARVVVVVRAWLGLGLGSGLGLGLGSGLGLVSVRVRIKVTGHGSWL